MTLKTWMLTSTLVLITAVLAGVFVLPAGQVPEWVLGRGGALATYGLGAAWVFLAVWVLDRLRRPSR